MHRLTQRVGPFALTRTLAWLRLCAIAGQCVAVLVCAWWMQLAIPLLPLLIGIGLLAVFAVFAAWRLRQPWPVRQVETIGHIAFDTLVLGYLLYFTGGASNPFITLLLVPIALSAAALSARTSILRNYKRLRLPSPPGVSASTSAPEICRRRSWSLSRPTKMPGTRVSCRPSTTGGRRAPGGDTPPEPPTRPSSSKPAASCPQADAFQS